MIYILCILCFDVARGMFTFATAPRMSTETWTKFPKMCLAGRVPPKFTLLEVEVRPSKHFFCSFIYRSVFARFSGFCRSQRTVFSSLISVGSLALTHRVESSRFSLGQAPARFPDGHFPEVFLYFVQLMWTYY